MTDEKKKGNPGLVARVSALEISMGEVKTDIKWIKIMVAPTLLISMASFLVLIIINLS